TGRVIASWARIDNRHELIAALSLPSDESITDPQLILAAYRKWGADCANRLAGDFSFVIYDPKTHEAYCARDCVGAKPFYYAITDSLFVVATSVAAIQSIGALKLTPSLEWMALFVCAFNLSDNQSAFEGVRKLPSAHSLSFSRDNTPETKRYFSFDLLAPHAVERTPEWVDRYREAFDHALRARTRSAFLIGSENSAGLDSASIIGSLGNLLPHDLDDFHTFAMVSAEHEPEKLEALSDMCGVRHTHILMRPEMLRIDDAFERALTIMGHPPEHGQTLVYPSFFEQSQSLGIRTMMSGFGGDEVVTHHARYLIDELQWRGEYRAVFDEIEGALPRRLARFVKRLWKGPADPNAPLRGLVNYKLRISCLRRDFIEDTGLAQRIEAWMCPERPHLTLNSLVGIDTGARASQAARLEASALYASTYGIEYRYPMLDRALIQQYLATPSIQKRHRGTGRLLHRQAMNGRIPDSICWQKTKSMGNFIGGTPAIAKLPVQSFEDLPGQLRTIIDQEAFEGRLQFASRAGSEFDDEMSRTRYLLWLVRQLSLWLD
ncbi:MAG: asparagine synthase-related protein, partial [Pseudomonadota bacterium]